MVLVVGGGVGGVVCANALRRFLPDSDRVVVVDRRREHVFAPSLLWVMVGWRRPEQITRSVRDLLQPGVEFVQGEVEEINPGRRAVRVGGTEWSYDALVVALGADLAPEGLPGFTEAACNFFQLEGASGLCQELGRFRGGRVVVLVSGTPYKCPAAPYEAALLLQDALRRRGLRGRSQVEVITPEPQPMPVAGPAMGRAVVELLRRNGVGFQPNRQVLRIDPEARELVFADGGREPFDLLAAVPPHRPPGPVRASPLANEAGWIPVDKYTLRTRWERVYALGDATTIVLANGKPLPKAGVFAHAQAEVVAARIAAELHAAAPREEFSGAGYCWIEMGGGQAAFATGQFYAEPEPVVPPPRVGRVWHLGKVLFERYWLGGGVSRAAARFALLAAAKLLGVPASL